jgi:hypothetical protein
VSFVQRLLLGLSLATVLAAAPPNFVFIVADDPGCGDIGVRGCQCEKDHLSLG